MKKLAKILQICCPHCRRNAHLFGRRRVSGPKKALFLPDLSSAVYFLLPREKNLLYAIRLTKEAMKTTLGGGTASCHQKRVRRRLPAVVGGLKNMHSDRRYPCGKILENKFLCASNSFHFISSVAFDFEYTLYVKNPKKSIKMLVYAGHQILKSFKKEITSC